jgi:hypothetical protein
MNVQSMKRDSISVIRLPSCREFLRQMEEVKGSLWRDFGRASQAPGHVLHLALNEAAALAWQTPFPDLLFTVLAQEKAAALNQWAARQRRMLLPGNRDLPR